MNSAGNSVVSRLQRLMLIVPLAALVATPASAQAVGPETCGPLANHYGPYDYRTQKDKLVIVEQYHFDAGVEALVRGMTSDRIGGDIGYTLLTSPNHHRALMAMIRLGEKLNNWHPAHMKYSIECYLERGLRFRPNDTVVRLLYAQWLGKRARKDEAMHHLALAIDFAKESGITHHNIGMLYLDLNEPVLALQMAHRARALGFNGTVLEERLKSAGAWKDPADAIEP